MIMDKGTEYLYETHLHTAPVSKCARAGVRETVEFYKDNGYKGIFITNHFIDGNINIDRSLPYEERINFFFSDYEEGRRIGDEIGLSGGVKMWVLYAPEEESSLKVTEGWIPFQMKWDLEDGQREGELRVQSLLRFLDARVVSAR